MVKIVLPGVWAEGGKSTFDTEAGPLPEVVKRFVAENPAYRRRLLGPDQEPAGYLNVCIDDVLVPRQARAATVVADGSTVTIIPPMAGG
ncbi:MoaD/ThiS family protein [Micromonospora sp. NPDC048999]|uniref:MoaD/ThiS family protein n=1 Tax=Micromonospora sp. NPDC048999 TaxID=3155391 RepID=UPI0034067766